MDRLNHSAGSSMLRWGLISALLVFPSAALTAADMVLNDLKAQNGIQLSTDELKQLLTDAKVVSKSKGNLRRWSNKSNGKFTASSDSRGQVGSVKQITGQGAWYIGDNGTFCIKIEWPKHTENWCKYIFKIGEEYYGVNSISDGAEKAYKYEFSK